MIKRISILMLALVPTMLWAQFAPEAGVAGTTAMHADSSAFVAWATGVEVERGPMNIAKPSLGLADFGPDLTVTLGKPGGTMDVVSLGDGGKATLTFASPIVNGPGPDFAVFENGLVNAQDTTICFLELAFVEVSSDGEHFFRFPAISKVQDTVQVGSFDCIHASLLHNFAGKYQVFYGTPFDLDEVEDNALLDKNKVTHVRIVDVVGCIDPEYATKDSEGHIVNDPWPTPFGSSGFDLDAVGVIHDLEHINVPENQLDIVSVYPNPVKDKLFVKAENLQMVEVFNAMGQLLLTSTVAETDLQQLPQGMYLCRIVCEDGICVKRIVKQ